MMGCAKDGTKNEFQSIKSSRASYKAGLEISEYANPFDNPANVVEQWTNKVTGQINQKIRSGPDKGVHRFYDPGTNRSGQTGITRFSKGGTVERRSESKPR